MTIQWVTRLPTTSEGVEGMRRVGRRHGFLGALADVQPGQMAIALIPCAVAVGGEACSRESAEWLEACWQPMSTKIRDAGITLRFHPLGRGKQLVAATIGPEPAEGWNAITPLAGGRPSPVALDQWRSGTVLQAWTDDGTQAGVDSAIYQRGKRHGLMFVRLASGVFYRL